MDAKFKDFTPFITPKTTIEQVGLNPNVLAREQYYSDAVPLRPTSSNMQQLFDYGRNYGVQTGEVVDAVGRGLRFVGMDTVGQGLSNVGTTTADYWGRRMTPETRNLLSQPALEDGVNVRKILMNEVVDPKNAAAGAAGKLIGLSASAIPSGVTDVAVRGLKFYKDIVKANSGARAAAKRIYR